MNYILLLFIIILIIVLLINADKIDKFIADYNHNCLTENPCGQDTKYDFDYDIYLKNKYIKPYLNKKPNYKDNDEECVYTDISKIKNPDVELDFYKDPAKYCSANPNKFPCPNYWIKNKKLEKSCKLPNPVKVKNYCKYGNRHELELCGVNDIN